MPNRPTVTDDPVLTDGPGEPHEVLGPIRLPANVRLLHARTADGRHGPIGQTTRSDDDVIRQLMAAALTPIEAYRQQLFRAARLQQEGRTVIDWWHAGHARRAVDAACIQFARLAPAAQRRVLAALPRPAPRLVAAASSAPPRGASRSVSRS